MVKVHYIRKHDDSNVTMTEINLPESTPPVLLLVAVVKYIFGTALSKHFL